MAARRHHRRPEPVRRIPAGAAFREIGPDGERWRPGAPFLRNAWYLAGFAQEFAQGLVARTILEEPILFFQDANGAIAALEDRCPHVGAPLSLGALKGGQVECGYHGMVFDGEGRCTAIPGQERIPSEACVYRYPLVRRAEHVWIWMGDPALADEHPVPDFDEDDEFFTWPRRQGTIPMDCNYSLMVQNLMDLTHLAYVHADSIGGDPLDHTVDKVTTRRTGQGMAFLREMRSVAPPARFVQRFGEEVRLDRWSDFEFVAPAVVRQNTGWGRVGTRTIEDRRGDFRDKMLHAITPATASSSYYFYDAADGADPDHDKARARLVILDKIIGEDVTIVEAQQQRLEGVDPRALVAIRSDRPRLMMIEELDRRLREELGA